MKFFAATLFAVAATANSDFLEHVAEYGLSYGTMEEYNFRLSNWANVDKVIREHNATESSYKLGHNKLSTWTQAEYKRLAGRAQTKLVKNVGAPVTADPPASIDWRTQGAVTPVKDQGQCGSCWSFSTTGCLEGIWKISGNELTSFSESQLLDCDYKLLKNKACNGGLPTWAYQYYTDGTGTAQGMTEADYPYVASRETCAYNNAKATKMIVTSQGAPTSDNVLSMKSAVAVQPVSVGVDASGIRFQAYKSGVFDGACGTNLDHATLVVGYGTDADTNQEYWIMKNSWGSSWGDEGYMRLVIPGDGPGQCGIQNDATWAKTGNATA